MRADGWMAVYMAACDADPAVRERPTDNKRPRGLKMPHLKSYTAQERKKEKDFSLFFFLAYSNNKEKNDEKQIKKQKKKNNMKKKDGLVIIFIGRPMHHRTGQ